MENEGTQSVKELVTGVAKQFARMVDDKAEAAALAEHARKVKELRNQWHAPEKHVAWSDSHYSQSGAWSDAVIQLTNKIARGGGIFVLAGNRGNGKTQLAVELMKYMTRNLRSARYTTETTLFMELRSASRRTSEHDENDVLCGHGWQDLLVIDEVGRQATTWEGRLMFELINRRYNAIGKSTILICNLPVSQVQDAIGSSIADRMNEGGGIIECTWPSFRSQPISASPVKEVVSRHDKTE